MAIDEDRFDMDSAPMRIGRVNLKVRDLALLSQFYQRVLGLGIVEATASRVGLGVGSTTLLELEHGADLDPLDPRQAGLFHTAFLLPSRSDLARWLRHAVTEAVALDGAADHIVSEALYLADPENNGIEVYADRPQGQWRTPTGKVEMASDPLDLDGLSKAAGTGTWHGFPEGGRIGHVHLRIGDIATADRFYRDVLGFELSTEYPGASFYGSGGYHHQLAGNIWKSRGAGPRPANMAGLGAVEIVAQSRPIIDAIAARAKAAGIVSERRDDALLLPDPWGTRLGVHAEREG